MKQKGQGILEFAIIVPMLVALGVSLVYVGIMFLDYTQYSNAARDAARDIALQLKYAEGQGSVYAANRSISAQRQYLVDEINKQNPDVLARYQTAFTNIYTPKWEAKFYKLNQNSGKLELATSASTADTVEITITLSMDSNENDGNVSTWGVTWNIIPVELKPITYKMTLEEANLVNYGS